MVELIMAYLLLANAKPRPTQSERLSIRVWPEIAQAGDSVRVTVRWPRQRDGLDGTLAWQLAYPGEGGHSIRELDDAPNQFVRTFDRMPSGVSMFTAEVCLRGTNRCVREEATVEVK